MAAQEMIFLPKETILAVFPANIDLVHNHSYQTVRRSNVHHG
jgi:hypothetical protein